MTMTMKNHQPALALIALLAIFLNACKAPAEGRQEGVGKAETPFIWENANVYFLLTDRFLNGDPDNDVNLGRSLESAPMRGYQGGDLKGVIQKLEEGYFEALGISALWLTPWFEQNKGITDEGTGPTYAYHGYWTQDWTSIDPNLGTEADLARLVELAHEQGIRILMDVVINHTGPVTDQDPVWPAEWVRTSPPCGFDTYMNTTRCTLVENLPDIRTESDQEVELPPALLEKWEGEGRLEQELAELEAFFQETGYPRAPRYYIIKWLTDYVRKYGIDGYRLDTAKHIEEGVWKELYAQASRAFNEWKAAHPALVLDQLDFYMVGEVYGYSIHSDRLYDFGDQKVDFFAQDIHSLINFSFIHDAGTPYETLFSSYDAKLQGPLKGQGVLNYLSSHDDHHPFDPDRVKAMEAATKLLLSPGTSQVYYGDESLRILRVEGAQGDAHLRSPMNWEAWSGADSVFQHYCKLGQFRKAHLAVGAGRHLLLSKSPYVFGRVYEQEDYRDAVVAALDLEPGMQEIPVEGIFEDGSEVLDYYSGQRSTVESGTVQLITEHALVLLGKP